MRSLRVVAAVVPILVLTACSSSSSDESSSGGDESPTSTVLVPVEKTADLVDIEGSVLGAVIFRQSATVSGTEIEIQAAGLAAGSHAMALHDVGDCAAADDEFGAVGDKLTEAVLSAIVVDPDGVGAATANVPPDLDTLLEGDGTALVIGPPEGASGVGPTGSQQACAAIS